MTDIQALPSISKQSKLSNTRTTFESYSLKRCTCLSLTAATGQARYEAFQLFRVCHSKKICHQKRMIARVPTQNTALAPVWLLLIWEIPLNRCYRPKSVSLENCKSKTLKTQAHRKRTGFRVTADGMNRFNQCSPSKWLPSKSFSLSIFLSGIVMHDFGLASL